MPPSQKEPYWSFWIILHEENSLPDITTIFTSSKANAESLYNAISSLMATAGNPVFANAKIPPTLWFAKVSGSQAES
jgi:hypothetical protein